MTPTKWSTACIGPQPEPFRAVAAGVRLGGAMSGMIDVLVDRRRRQDGRAERRRPIAAQDDLRLVALVDPQHGRRGRRRRRAFADVDAALALHVARGGARVQRARRRVRQRRRAARRPACRPWSAPPASTTTQVDELAPRPRPPARASSIVPNFALGAVLLMRFAAEAARYYEHAEIIEMHEEGKIDAPSGTSCARRGSWPRRRGPPWRRRARRRRSRRAASSPTAACTIHSVRLPGVVAHQEVLFGGEDEVLTLRHDSLSRRSFMSGVLLALRRVAERRGDGRRPGEPPRLSATHVTSRRPHREERRA